MEAMLGAVFVTGVSMALLAGVSLGLAFSGGTPWPLRYELALSDKSSVPQESLGYSFCAQNLLQEPIHLSNPIVLHISVWSFWEMVGFVHLYKVLSTYKMCDVR